jgi:hypothetical protein
MNRIWPILGILVLFVGFNVAGAASGSQVVSTQRFQGQVPGEGWKQLDNADELGLKTTAKVEMYLKKDNGSLILIRSGRNADFGVPGNFDFFSDDAELVYLMKFIPGGDYVTEVKLETKNPLLSHAKAYVYKVQHKRLGLVRELAVMFKGRDTVLIEFLASPDDFDKGSAGFYKFLDSLRQKVKK